VPDQRPITLHESVAVTNAESRRPLTERQAAVLKFIRSCIRKTGVPPSSVEIQRRFDLRTNAAAQQTIWALEHKGYIATTFGVKRSIQLIEMPTPKPK
jgi:SOS-response transcriptional repressor LexA